MRVDDIRRLVVKAGTAVIAEESGRINPDEVISLVGQITEARRRDIDVALVSSGAIAAGIEALGVREKPTDVQTLQAVAAVGQGLLVRMYTDLFGENGITVGQVLLTQSGMTHRQQYLNARHTMEKLFEMGAVPVINENNTVATEETSFGENDLLSALVAALVGAELLVLLTDTGGLYTEDPSISEKAVLFEQVDHITDEIECIAGDAGTGLGSGGMLSKIQAAKIAVNAGVHTVIADGRQHNVIIDILDGKQVGTRFTTNGRVASKKHWIGYARKSCGRLVIDAGAVRAITREGKSLLPAGVIDVEGDFVIGDSVDIVDSDGEVVGRGLTNYDAEEAGKIKGLKSSDVFGVLGEEGEEIIHRDCMVIFDTHPSHRRKEH